MEAVFTIVAKNYLARAITLGDSIKKNNPELDFFIFLADEIGDADIASCSYKVIEAKDINILYFYTIAFQYNILELLWQLNHIVLIIYLKHARTIKLFILIQIFMYLIS